MKKYTFTKKLEKIKKIIASILTVLTVGASAQLTYVITQDDDVESSLMMQYNGDNFIENNKYLISYGPWHDEDMPGEYYDILNPDFSFFKRIIIDTAGWGALGINRFEVFFSDHLYNSDDKVELIYSIKRDWDIPFKTVVLDEDGVVLQTIDNVCLDISSIFQSNGKTYFQVKNEENKYDIYEAGGTLPCKSCSTPETTGNKKAFKTPKEIIEREIEYYD